MKERIYLSNTQPLKFDFSQSKDTFYVKENSRFKLHKKGEFRLLEAKKEDISTIEMVEYLCEVLKTKPNDIGYAGLKDKHATTLQYITLPKYVNIKKFKNTQRVTLKEIGFIQEPLRVGALESNSFQIVLSSVASVEFAKIDSIMQKIAKIGFANYFGYQRFGVLNDSIAKGKKIADIGKGSKNQKSRILLAAYQAKYFNNWLTKRLEISAAIAQKEKHPLLTGLSPTLLDLIASSNIPYKLLPGDLGYFYKKGRKEFHSVNDIKKYTELFEKRSFHTTGLLFGSRVRFANSIAGKIERDFVDYTFDALRGARRDAWVFLRDYSSQYNENKKEATLNFTLPPGSYATVVIEELLNRSLF
jgi:tRNA pseudouridine13 synthase